MMAIASEASVFALANPHLGHENQTEQQSSKMPQKPQKQLKI